MSEGFLLAIGGCPQEYHLRPSPGGLISSLQGAWIVLDGIIFIHVPSVLDLENGSPFFLLDGISWWDLWFA